MVMNPTGSKGIAQRPVQNKKKFNENWDRIFKQSKSDIEDKPNETRTNSTPSS